MSDMSELHVICRVLHHRCPMWCCDAKADLPRPKHPLDSLEEVDLETSPAPLPELRCTAPVARSSRFRMILDIVLEDPNLFNLSDIGYCSIGYCSTSIIYRSPNFIDPDCVMPL